VLGSGAKTAAKAGAALGGVAVASALLSMLPDPSSQFADMADLEPSFASAEQVQDGLARLSGLTTELHGALASLIGRFLDTVSDGTDAPLSTVVPTADTSSALWDSIYQELCDMYVAASSPALVSSLPTDTYTRGPANALRSFRAAWSTTSRSARKQ
jgi:hypothetical protein